MLKIAGTELTYNLASVLAWSLVLLVMSSLPFIEAGDLTAVPSVLAFMTLGLLPITPVFCFLLINVERNEQRQRFWNMLPVARTTVAGARLLRAASLPLVACVVGAGLVVLAAIFTGPEIFQRLNAAWALGFLVLASIALGVFVTLLYDLGGMAFAQVTSVLLLVAGFVSNSYVPAFERLVVQVNSLAQTAGGVLLIAGICVSLMAANVFIYHRRRK